MIPKIFLMFFLLASAFAETDCTPVNLITMPNSPFHKIPVYDQMDANICYAYSASQILDYYLIMKGSQRASVHPLWLALNYALSKNRKSLNIGHTKDAIDRLRDVKNCDSEVISEALIHWAGTRELSDAKIIGFIEKHSEPSLPPPIVDPSTKKIVSRLRQMATNSVSVVARILLPYCQQRQSLHVPRISSYNFSQLPDDQAFEIFMKKMIGKNPYPISVAYCSNVWWEKNYDGIDITSLGTRDLLKEDCDYHESLIVGRKFMEKSCQFLVRNTWGADWRSGNRHWKCLCKDKMTGQFSDDCSSRTHPSNRFIVEACWLPSDRLSRNVGVVNFIE